MYSPYLITGAASAAGRRAPINVGLFTVIPIANSNLYRLVDNTLGLTILTGNRGRITSWLRTKGIKL